VQIALHTRDLLSLETDKKSQAALLAIFTTSKAYARGLGLNPHLELDILRKLYYLRKGD